jgi:hypothetical protein|tara:strand:+ start:641 stop:946 length:306 start_codon:yes stop_codon:yes gene_type:complete
MIGKAILEINPNAIFSINGGDGHDASTSDIEWLEDTAPISNEDINAKVAEIKVRDAHVAPRQRAYPSIQDQLDMMYKDEVNGTTTWKDAIAQVKADYPKSE